MGDKELDFSKKWDVVIVGMGPAAYSAGIYACRYNMSVLIVGDVPGGAVTDAHLIENYPGTGKISGLDLAQKMKDQYLDLNGKLYGATVVKIEKDDSSFEITTSMNKKIVAKTVIVAIGTKRRKINVEGEDKFVGRGVSYCATCDAPFFKNKTVCVVGGGNSAFDAALHLSKFASKVYLIHRRLEFRADPVTVDLIKKQTNIEFILNSVVTKIEGDSLVKNIKLKNVKTNKISDLNVDGVFVEIGGVPFVSLLGNKVDLDESGFIKVKQDMSTNVPGLFAAGDCTNAMNNIKQIVTAVASGTIATESAYKYVNKNKM